MPPNQLKASFTRSGAVSGLGKTWIGAAAVSPVDGAALMPVVAETRKRAAAAVRVVTEKESMVDWDCVWVGPWVRGWVGVGGWVGG